MAYYQNQNQQEKKVKLTTNVEGQLIDKSTTIEKGRERFELLVFNKDLRENLIVRVPEEEFEKLHEGDFLAITADIYVSNKSLKFYCKEPKKLSLFSKAINE